ncbi:MAG: hypothetical protein ACE5HS_16505 [bacterium]
MKKREAVYKKLMQSYRVCTVVGVVLLTALQAFSYGKLQQQSYAFDFLTFKGTAFSNKTTLEIFSQISTNSLQFVKFKEGFFASYELSLGFYNASGAKIHGASYIDTIKVKSFAEIDKPRPPQLIRFHVDLDPGFYQAKINLKDLETLEIISFDRDLDIPDYRKSELQFSDLQIASSITYSNEKSVLVKNNQKIIPNVTRVVGRDLKVLYIYSEVYNLHYNANGMNKNFIATFTIRDQKGHELKTISNSKEKPGSVCSLSIGIPVHDLQAGTYNLILNVKDLDSGQIQQKSTQFFVI